MHTVPIIPDELLVGYRGRLAALNNCKSNTEIHSLLRKEFPAPEGFSGQSHLVPNLARALKVSTRELLHRHTMWPLFAAFPEQAALEEPQLSPYADNNSSVWLKTARPRLALCPACISEDMAGLNFSYWRRSHQLPGLFMCPKHEVELRFVTIPSLLAKRPDQLQSDAQPSDPVALSASMNNPLASKALKILTAILDAEVTVSRDVIGKSLRRFAFVREGGQAMAQVVKELSNRIYDALPQAWMTDFMPNARYTDRDRLYFVLAALIDSKSNPLSAAAVAVVAAQFLDTEEAVRMLTSVN